MRLSQTARKFNVGTSTIVSYLQAQGIDVAHSPNTKITPEQIELLQKAFSGNEAQTTTAKKQPLEKPFPETKTLFPKRANSAPVKPLKLQKPKLQGLSPLGKINLRPSFAPPAPPVPKAPAVPAAPTRPAVPARPPIQKPLQRTVQQLKPLQVLRKVHVQATPVHTRSKTTKPSSNDTEQPNRRLRKRIFKSGDAATSPGKRPSWQQRSKKEEKQRTLEEMMHRNMPFANKNKYRKERKEQLLKSRQEADQRQAEADAIIHVAPSSTPQELAKLFHTSVTDLLGICMELGIIVSLNQRLDQETISILADELEKKIDFITPQVVLVEETVDTPESLKPRAPIITVMGHVDHGKTSFLDYIRKTRVTEKEAGGITQNIGAYDVFTKGNRRIVFLDTPGHEAFTAMRARGSQITDIAIIIIAADDGIMPQTDEAISHAKAAGMPIIIGINKMDKPQANPERVKEQLAQKDILVESWGGTYQCQEISAKTGAGIDELLEKVLLQADLMDLKANPDKKAKGVIVEASLAKGRGYIATTMIQSGTLKKGDAVFSGMFYGKVKALINAQGTSVKRVLPATPIQVLGLNGPPSSGEPFYVVATEKEAKRLAQEHQRLARAHKLNIHKAHSIQVTQQKILGAAVSDKKELLNILIKADVDGVAEALSNSLIKLSDERMEVHVIHKAVGPISESDVLLATASNALIIGFKTSTTTEALKLARKEKITIKRYQIIYKAIEDTADHIEKLLAPTEEEIVSAKALVKKIFQIGGVGTVAGCEVTDGTIKQHAFVRLVRDGIEIARGKIKYLKRDKEQIKEAKKGTTCGIFVTSFGEALEKDWIEAIEIKKK